MQQPITPCLWFDNQAQEAAKLYCEQFANTKIVSQSPMVTEIQIDGQNIVLLDGGPQFKPNPSISLFYIADTEADADRIWKALTDGGQILMPLDKYDWSEKYGWCADRFGISWQVALGKLEDVGQRVTPALLFTGKQYGRAEEALEHYSSIFKDVKVDGIMRDEAGKVVHAQAAFNGSKLMFMDSNEDHPFQFSEGVSLTIYCETQEEIDHYWYQLTEGGAESMCGWLKDKFGVWWQVIPSVLGKIMSDPAKAGKAAQAFMAMRKLDIEAIVQATL